ncbi:hypothetical protein Dsin_033115 [Dipteronia sinensis]|uniref:Transmembrane protein n=1 Tax=Dipteronia sinensis TaxID=43782 RepID=A0AAD9Z4X6_9ROSI|nr:hypothetical protein Dsin_000165 [Dipteronia sinensis]KAK3175617.1 hypothetical protein Dsin_033115 [Dipteronia sinensis]
MERKREMWRSGSLRVVGRRPTFVEVVGGGFRRWCCRLGPIVVMVWCCFLILGFRSGFGSGGEDGGSVVMVVGCCGGSVLGVVVVRLWVWVLGLVEMSLGVDEL